MASRSLHRSLAAAIYGVLAVAATCLLLRWNTDIGIVLFFALLLPLFLLLRWPNAPKLLFLGFFIMVAGKLAYALTLDPLKGPDERHYYAQVAAFQNLSEFVNYAWEQIVQSGFNVSAYPIFGLAYMPFYKLVSLDDPLAIVVFNSLLLILVANATSRICRDHFSYELPLIKQGNLRLQAWVAFGILASPSFMFMSSIFAKDITSVLLGLLGATLLIRRKYLMFVLVLLYATGLRDYAIVYTLGYWLLLRGRMKSALAMLLVCLGAVFVVAGPSGLINAGLLTFFLYLSPNPFRISNWDSVLLYRTLEAVWMSFSLGAAAVVYIKAPAARPFYRICFVVLLTYACTLILVGYMTVVTRELDYGVGTIGDNMLRKKLPVLPLLYLFSVYTIMWLGKLLRASLPRKEVFQHAGKRPIQPLQAGARLNRPAAPNRAAAHPQVDVAVE